MKQNKLFFTLLLGFFLSIFMITESYSQPEALTEIILTGQVAFDLFGLSVSSAGDVNGDGYSDVIIGDVGGRTYIYFGGTSMDNIADVIMIGSAGDRFGTEVSTAGDVNGDGYSDVVIGEPQNDAGGLNAGRTYIYFGGTSMDNTPDVIMTGEAAGDVFGSLVSTAGDVNGDGYSDVIVGAFSNDAGGTEAGRAYIYFGGTSMDNIADVIMTGEAAGDWFGNSVSTAGDVNGDGYSDVIVGGYNNDAGGNLAGRSYIYFGGTSMDNIADVIMSGEAIGDRFGNSVSTAGDVNGDGYNDVIVGAWYYTGGLNVGRSYIYFGGTSMDNTPDVIMTGETADDYFGNSVSTSGDVNGDGYSDVIVGAVRNDAGGSDAGRSYIYFGGTSMDNTADVIMTGEAAGDYFGGSVSTAGDVNGDGYGNVVIGAGHNDAGGTDAGRAYIYAIFEPEFGIISGTVSVSGNGLTSVTVKLLDEFGLPVVGFDDVNTDINGEYSFVDVPVGDYQVMIVEPPEYTADLNPKPAVVTENETTTVDFNLTCPSSWTPTSLTNAPTARQEFEAVWTGSKMIVWSGGGTNTGGIYDPVTDTWTATTTVDAPAPMTEGYAAVWTGSTMIVWDGNGPGGIYDPATDSWTPMSTDNAPTAREEVYAVWTGSKMIIWGGSDAGGRTNTGGIYNPSY